jgi:hypothetical protein
LPRSPLLLASPPIERLAGCGGKAVPPSPSCGRLELDPPRAAVADQAQLSCSPGRSTAYGLARLTPIRARTTLACMQGAGESVAMAVDLVIRAPAR